MAEDVTLLIKLQDQASPKLKRLTQSTKRLEQAANGAQNSIRRTNKGIRDTGRVADRASKGVNKLGKAVRGLIAGFTAVQAFKFVIFKTAELERQTKSLQVLTGSLGNARNIIAELQQFGAVTPFTSAELIETAKRLKAFGFETEQVVDVTKRLADVAGATGADLGGIATAFGQIQAKGRLQGEELLQLQERGVGLQDELQKMYGLTADEFRKALEGGRISADAVNLALKNITETGGKYADGAIAQSETLSGKFSTLVDNITVLAQHIGDALKPALKGILSLTNQILAGFNDILSSQVARGVASTKLAMLTPGGTMGDIAQMRANVAAMPTTTLRDEASIQETARRLTDIQNFLSNFGVTLNTTGFTKASREQIDALEGVQRLIQDQLNALGKRQIQIAAEDKPTVVEPPELLTRTNNGRTGGKTPEERAAEALKKQQEEAQKLLLTKKQQLLLINATSDKERNSLQLTIDKFNLARQFPDLSEDELQVLRDQLDANFRATQLAEVRLKQEEELNRQLKEQEAQAKQLDDAFRNGIVDALTAAIEGTKSLGDALLGVIKQMARLILQQQLLNALSGFNLFGGGGGGGGGIPASFKISGMKFFANGGRPPVGRPSVVGERGPELFVPDRAGTIIPNGGFGGANVVVNVDASGSSVQGDEGSSRQLGALIGAAVQGEIIKQQRPGGLLSR